MHTQGSLYHFPQLHKGACFYDILSRFHEESGHFTSLATSKELFGSCPDLRPSVVLPYRAELIYTWLGSSTNITLETLRDKYSAWPYLQIDSRFSANEMEPILRTNAKPGRRKQAEMRFAIQNRISRLRYCPMCVASDFMEEGEVIWHQVHQIFGVRYCPIHGVPLIDSEVSLEKKLSQYVPASNLLVSSSLKKMITLADESMNQESKFKHTHLNLSRTINWLLENGLSFDKSDYFKKYRKILSIEKNNSPEAGEKLRDFLLSTIGMAFLEDLLPNGTVNTFLENLNKMGIDYLSPLCNALILVALRKLKV